MQSSKRYFIKPTQHIHAIPHSIQQLYICGYNPDNVDRLVLSSGNRLNNLTDIIIGKDCCKSIHEFVIDALPRLESVRIDNESFNPDHEDSDCDEYSYYDVEDEDIVQEGGICRITNCPNLRQLEIDDQSFRYFTSFHLSSVNSLQSIEFGRYCFENADLSLKGE